MKKKPLIDEDGEVRELTRSGLRGLKRAEEVLPPELLAIWPKRKPGQRGPGKKPAKVVMSFRLDPDLAQRIRASGDGFNGRVAETLGKAFPKATTKRA